MTYTPGDRVHVAGIGTGVVREVRGSRRYAIDIKGRLVIAAERDLELAGSGKARKKSGKGHDTVPGAVEQTAVSSAAPALDLHGKTVAEGLEALATFVNDALLDGRREVRVIHGRSGGKIKAAVHEYLRQLSSARSVRLDPQNPGVTIVTFS